MQLIIGFLALLTTGCAHFKQHTGQFQPYLCTTLKDHGATLPKSIPLYAGLPANWQAKSDQYGIIILAPRKSFNSIDKILRGIFGDPQIWTNENLNGGQHGVYSWREIGCAVQYFEEDDYTKIIILRKQTGAEQSPRPYPSKAANDPTGNGQE